MNWDLATPFALRVRDAAADAGALFVGGAVRDLLIGQHFGDVDLVTESRAGAVAAAIAAALGGRVREYPQFLTAKVLVGRDAPVDVATARRESYPRPGALPVVARGTIEDDLFRRDFTVNAMALRLRGEVLIDPYEGARDLRSRTLRVLHDRSFIDDPTRILRGLRIGARLGMSLEPATEALARDAIAGGAMETVSRERLWREVLLAFDEPDPAAALIALADSGAIEKITGLQSAPQGVREFLPHLAGILNRHPRLDREATLAGALIAAETSAAQMAGSGFSAARRGRVLEVAGAWAGRSRGRRSVERPEVLAVEAALDPSRRDILEERLRKLEAPLPFRGGDLGVPPGPHIGKAMAATRVALLEGATTESEARDFARGLALRYLKERNPRD